MAALGTIQGVFEYIDVKHLERIARIQFLIACIQFLYMESTAPVNAGGRMSVFVSLRGKRRGESTLLLLGKSHIVTLQEDFTCAECMIQIPVALH